MDWRLALNVLDIEPPRAIELEQHLDHAHPLSVCASRLIECRGAKFICVQSVCTHFIQRSHRLFIPVLHCSAKRGSLTLATNIRRVEVRTMLVEKSEGSHPIIFSGHPNGGLSTISCSVDITTRVYKHLDDRHQSLVRVDLLRRTIAPQCVHYGGCAVLPSAVRVSTQLQKGPHHIWFQLGRGSVEYWPAISVLHIHVSHPSRAPHGLHDVSDAIVIHGHEELFVVW
mmetsp:Transcript_9016/g.21120  ORF Transcript_9016/g.21120 Transcript_9016/m.21120 type:complete len:227 (-) Transcript_9016:179-859(-)